MELLGPRKQAGDIFKGQKKGDEPGIRCQKRRRLHTAQRIERRSPLAEKRLRGDGFMKQGKKLGFIAVKWIVGKDETER